MVRMAIIGIGGMGKKYAEMINKNKISGLKLVAVCCRSAENKQWAKDNLTEDVAVYGNIDELFEREQDFDAVLIVTPHKLHPEMALQAFAHKKHVFCDKPAGVSVTEAKMMSEAAKQSGMKYAMMFHQRTYEVHKYLKQIIENKELGDILRIMMESNRYYRTNFYHKSGTWRSSFTGEGGGALINQGQHILDIWQWLFGMPEAIYAKIPFGKYNDFLVDDEVTLIMSYPENVYATFILTTGEAFPGEHMDIIGTKGRAVVEGNTIRLSKSELDSREYAKTAEENAGEYFPRTYEKIEFAAMSNEGAYIQMLQNFTDAVTNGAELIADGEEGEKALEIANGAYLSASAQKEIAFPIDEDQYAEFLQAMIEKEKK